MTPSAICSTSSFFWFSSPSPTDISIHIADGKKKRGSIPPSLYMPTEAIRMPPPTHTHTHTRAQLIAIKVIMNFETTILIANLKKIFNMFFLFLLWLCLIKSSPASFLEGILMGKSSKGSTSNHTRTQIWHLVNKYIFKKLSQMYIITFDAQ